MRKFRSELKTYLRDILLTVRRDLGLTQEKMAEKLRMSTRSYCDLERGKMGFSAVSLVLLLVSIPPDMVIHILQTFLESIQELEQKEVG